MSYLNNVTAPPGGSVRQRNTLQEAFNFDLFEAVFTAANLKLAWKQVKANKGAAGIDGMSIDDFPMWAKQHWQQYKASLLNGRYRLQPVRRVEIDKPDGGKRQLAFLRLSIALSSKLSYKYCHQLSPRVFRIAALVFAHNEAATTQLYK